MQYLFPPRPVGFRRRYALFLTFLLVGELNIEPVLAQQKDLPKSETTRPEPKHPKIFAPDQTHTRAYVAAARRTAPPQLLKSGPMVTYSTMREVGLWVQLGQAGAAQVEYWEKGRPQKRWHTSVTTTTGPDHIAELVADSVRPGRKYSYRLWASDIGHERLRVVPRPYPLEFQSQTLWEWRTAPPAFRVALGSCAYVNDSLYDRPDKPYGGSYEIFSSIDQNKPDLMVWLGDNTYLREADWDSPTGIRRRYAHTRALPALQPLLGSVHHYATWDDHDYGPNDADRSYALRETTLQTFRRYWPALGSGQGGGGVASTFQWADVQFFLLDNRWHRTPNRDDAAHGQLLGPAQLQWLTESLAASRATFKIVCVGGQVLNPAKIYENYANYEAERAELLRRLADTRVPGVLFVTGDRHHAELTRLDRPGLYPLYDLTTSPLTAGVAPNGRREANPLRDTATFRAERNFALLDVGGPEKARTLTLTLCGADGRPLWKRELRATDLQVGATPPAPGPVRTSLAVETRPATTAPAADSVAAPTSSSQAQRARNRPRRRGANARARAARAAAAAPAVVAVPLPAVPPGSTRWVMPQPAAVPPPLVRPLVAVATPPARSQRRRAGAKRRAARSNADAVSAAAADDERDERQPTPPPVREE